jgi:hypothetical protein
MVQACCRLLMDSFNNKCAILKIAMHCGLTKENKMLSSNLVPRAFLVVARELRKTHSRTQSPSYARCDEGLWPNPKPETIKTW